MENFEKFKDVKEVKDLIEKYLKLQYQINNPTRNGMIEALSGAQQVAGSEIVKVEHSQGDVVPTPWDKISYQNLYRKLSQYQQGIYNHCVNKYGESVFKQMIEDYGNNKD